MPCTVAITLEAPSADPDADRIEAALRKPARPLFIGRKCCLPAEPVFLMRLEAESLRDALAQAPLSPRAPSGPCRIWLPAEGAHERGALPVTDERDWDNQIHVGRRFIREYSIDV